jgi:Protein of unknown function (DUF3365)
MRRVWCALLATAILLSAPGSERALAQTPGGAWPTYKISEAPPELRFAIQRADLVIVSLQDTMLAELARDLNEGGPAFAVRSCHIDTTSAAYRLARYEGIEAGRTSDRLRAPTNLPKPWARPIVAEYAGKRAADVEGFAVDLGSRVGVLRPMAERPTCAACHGDRDKLDPRVRAELESRYPADRALFFKPGELRGWFWVELPKVDVPKK